MVGRETCFQLLVLALLGVTSRAQPPVPKGLPAGLNLRELEGLLHVIDPSTCGCAMPTQHCQIPVPQAKFLGVSCQVGEFCCKRRLHPGSRITPEELKQLARLHLSQRPDPALRVSTDVVKQLGHQTKDPLISSIVEDLEAKQLLTNTTATTTATAIDTTTTTDKITAAARQNDQPLAGGHGLMPRLTGDALVAADPQFHAQVLADPQFHAQVLDENPSQETKSTVGAPRDTQLSEEERQPLNNFQVSRPLDVQKEKEQEIVKENARNRYLLENHRPAYESEARSSEGARQPAFSREAKGTGGLARPWLLPGDLQRLAGNSWGDQQLPTGAAANPYQVTRAQQPEQQPVWYQQQQRQPQLQQQYYQLPQQQQELRYSPSRGNQPPQNSGTGVHSEPGAGVRSAGDSTLGLAHPGVGAAGDNWKSGPTGDVGLAAGVSTNGPAYQRTDSNSAPFLSLQDLGIPEDVKGFIKPVAALRRPQTTRPGGQLADSGAEAAEISRQAPTNRDCRCVGSQDCHVEDMDLRFGKSCPYGEVHCCRPADQVALGNHTNMASLRGNSPVIVNQATPAAHDQLMDSKGPADDKSMEKGTVGDQLIGKKGTAGDQLIDHAFRRPASGSPGQLGQVRPVNLPIPVVLPHLLTEPATTTASTTNAVVPTTKAPTTTTTTQRHLVFITTTEREQTTTTRRIRPMLPPQSATSLVTSTATTSSSTTSTATTSTASTTSVSTSASMESLTNNTSTTGGMGVRAQSSHPQLTSSPSSGASKPAIAQVSVVPAVTLRHSAPPNKPLLSIPWYPAVPPSPTPVEVTPAAVAPPRVLTAAPARPVTPMQGTAPLAERNDNNKWQVPSGSGYGIPADRVPYRQPVESQGFVQTVGQTALDVAKRLFSWPF